MTGVITYMLTFDRLPDLDAQGRPKMFYSQRNHDKCYRRPHFDAGQFAEKFDDAGARMGYCLYKLGCKGPTTYNACSSVRWNEGVSWPVQSGPRLHRLLGGRLLGQGFLLRSPDDGEGPRHCRRRKARPTGSVSRRCGVAGAAVAAHAAVSAIKQARSHSRNDKVSEVEEK